MICVAVELPFTLVAVNDTVYVPAVFQMTPVTFCVAELAGFPEGKVHAHDVGAPVDASVKFTGNPTHTLLVLIVNAAIGPGQGFT